jgi:hypothetical protein
MQCHVDAAIVNPTLSGTADWLAGLHGAVPQLKVVLIQNPGIDVPASLRSHKVMKKPAGSHPVLQQEWSRDLLDLLNRRHLIRV